MCEHEAYGINRYGTPENVKSLTPQRLYEAWKALLSSGRLQFNLVGEADVRAAQSLLKEELSRIEREATPADAWETQIIRARSSHGGWKSGSLCSRVSLCWAIGWAMSRRQRIFPR